jgi:hypothetical protein
MNIYIYVCVCMHTHICVYVKLKHCNNLFNLKFSPVYGRKQVHIHEMSSLRASSLPSLTFSAS